MRVEAVRLGLACLLLGACLSSSVTQREMTAGELVGQARARGVPVEDPLELSVDMRQEIEAAIGKGGAPRARLQKLGEHLLDRAGGFKHIQGISLPVQRAYRERRGDCITYAMLFVALSRHLGLRTHFMHANEVLSYQEHGESLYAASHIAVGFADGPDEVIVDFDQEYNNWRLLDYRQIDDAAAISLYFNNVAAYSLLEGRAAEAEALLQFLVDTRPDLAELHNNLIVAHLRSKNFEAALEAARRGMVRFPTYMPFFTNAIQAAYSAGKPELARQFEVRAKEIAGNDPLFIFARGLQLYHRADYALAIAYFQRAVAARRDSIVMLAWLVRAHFAAGHHREGLQVFAIAKRLAPQDPRLGELMERYPVLKTTRY